MSLQEVTVRIRFSTECLGAVRRRDCNEMERDPSGRVMFMATWWKSLMRFASKVLNRHHSLVDKIEWDPVVDGVTRLWRNYYKPNRYTVHEAFLRGDVIEVNCVIPSELEFAEFRLLMEVAGAYKGISPYRPADNYGIFEVLEVSPKTRAIKRGDSEAVMPAPDS